MYTPEEINALIPRLEYIATRLQRRTLELRKAVLEVEDEAGRVDVRALFESGPDLRVALDELDALLREIEALGGRCKGLDLGRVDFSAEIDGEPVLLCRQLGEKEVAFCRDFEHGFAGRKPLFGGRRGYVQ